MSRLSARVTCPACRAENDEQATNCFSCSASLGPSPSSVSLGSVIAARYEILALLGRGGMGVVYKAHDRTLDETVALKLLRPEVAGRPEMAQRFRSEIKLARKVRHENVCGIHEYGEDGRQHYIAMEFVEGVNLRDLLREHGGLTQREAFDLSIQAVQGLQAIHDAGIIHRDLKPSNIMRDSQGFVRLMDFGIAKRQGSDATIDGRVSGTPEYMSPEQARGKPLDHRSDIYALAIVIYELFTGQVPFRADTPVATALKHLHEPPPLSGPKAQRLPASLVPVLRKALAKQPAERYATAQEMAMALQEARTAAGFEPPPSREPGVHRASASPLALALAKPDPEAAGPTLVDLDTFESGVTATQVGRATVTELQSPAGFRPAPRAPTPRAATRLHGGPALLGATLLLIGLLGAWLLGIPHTGAPVPSPTPAPVVSASPPTAASIEPPLASLPSSAAPLVASASSRPVADRPRIGSPKPAPASPVFRGTPTTNEPSAVDLPPRPAEPSPGEAPVAEPAPPVSEPEAASPPIPLPPSAVQPVPDPGNRPPEYPQTMQDQSRDAQVYLKIVLSAAGFVEDVQVLAGEAAFAEAAVSAVREWSYSPALVEGRPTPVYFVVKVPFRGRKR